MSLLHIGSGKSKRTFGPKWRAILPKQIVVLVRIPGCSSLDVFASCFSNSPLIIRSLNFVITVKTALTVCSRSNGARSVKPVTYDSQQMHMQRDGSRLPTICGKILSLTTFCGRWSIMMCKLFSKQTRMPRSGLENSRTITGVIMDSYCSSDIFAPIFMTEAKTLGPPPPNSIDFKSSGSTLIPTNSLGNSSATSSSSLSHNKYEESRVPIIACLRMPSLSLSLLRPRLSIASENLISGISKNPPLRRP